MPDVVIALLTYGRAAKATSLAKQLIATLGGRSEHLLIIENPSEVTIDQNELGQGNYTYVLKSRNRGLDNSILQAACFAKRKSTMIWFLCDDDTLCFERLPSILDHIKKTDNSVVHVPWANVDGTTSESLSFNEKYLRMSFLPTVCCDPSPISVRDLVHLKGTNYLHISMLNEVLNASEDIGEAPLTAGIQSRNSETRFPVLETFLFGYSRTLTHKAILPRDQIEKTVYRRASAALSFFKGKRMSFTQARTFLVEIFSFKFLTFRQKLRFSAKVVLRLWF